ncbi:MAG: hypothetical protein A2Z64_10500 [Betaproteobacteria bacterium RIFCSPLOWO2_02_67_12]|nr:MAG: hypothetical protein A2Z64_10500 [Betaproteobacteria bacterium RIFCSPLOWO2_02_67_12]OGA70492.1 MAG: hypothetical protein A3F77_08025 [Betaproteobacteria bacterium RIFCSPLOWO2_12_FULL_67_28]
MNQKRSLLRAAGALLALGLVPRALAQGSALVTVYKSPTCGCCGDWVKHLRANGFRLEVHDLGDVSPIRRRYGVPGKLASCHTAVVAGYAIEGHVPAADIKRLLRERPKVIGLAVPGMVIGSPGMEQGAPQPYETLAFDERGYRVFARH